MNILYFDDEPFISKALATNLKLIYNRNIKLVSEINDLFDEFVNNSYDIIILDIMTPIPETGKGYELFTKKEIKAICDGMSTGLVLAKKIWELNEKIPILFLSARSRPNDITIFEQEGKRCAYLRKPELAKTINETLCQLLTNSN